MSLRSHFKSHKRYHNNWFTKVILTHIPWCSCRRPLWTARAFQPCCPGPATSPSAISWWASSTGWRSQLWPQTWHPCLQHTWTDEWLPAFEQGSGTPFIWDVIQGFYGRPSCQTFCCRDTLRLLHKNAAHFGELRILPWYMFCDGWWIEE